MLGLTISQSGPMQHASPPSRSTSSRSSFQAVSKNPVYLQVAEQMREAILAGTLAHGEQLPTERALCVQFGVSRASIREALRVLQAQGLLSGRTRTTPHRTTVSRGPNDSLSAALAQTVRLRNVGLGDLVDLRCALETTTLERAAERRLPAPLAAAAAELAVMRDPSISVEAFHLADVRFHLALVAASGNEALLAVMSAVRDSISEHLLTALRALPNQKQGLKKLCVEHEAIYAAVIAGNGPLAAQLGRAHVENFYRRAKRWLKEAP